ncbi:hypothetical protein AWM68_11475 [Fictibacillus phosphorivorans]|uniref:Uncharacterized protein n=1 Tax=Fictibacillus phosphorivorans TaxID=1221500 RepID=A0A165MWP3_9BACL|nr:hypothetical protein [Fictibacillus phosphorivorans]KZE63730.1 hypothetical protein AWM68_11475 [Fictibacillus phosphorivorans]
MVTYSARLTKSGVNSWAVEFRHPVLMDREGKQGRKIRRGLGINKDDAQLIVDDLNGLLEDETLWSLTEQKHALSRFNPKVVDIFYSQMEEDVISDPWEIRNSKIKIPKNTEGYARVMYLGTTGAGKTTVIRQMIGTEPDEISFPAISASRTTTCNTEYIFKEGNWSGIVTFISQAQTIKLIEECVWEAFRRAAIGEDTKTIAKAFLSHPEQRFRLSYFLGQYRSSERKLTPSKGVQEDVLETPYPDQEALKKDIEYILQQIQLLAEEAKNEFPPDGENVDEIIDELYEVYVREDTERFNDLVQYVLGLIKKRFDVIQEGTIHRDTRGWPLYWQHESEDKWEVIKMMRWFAGNEGRRFGQLLAPVVNGVRLQGPFKPSWWTDEKPPRLVVIDGEGIGHDSNITTSIPMEVTNRFKETDAVVLVDNATQPMLDIPKVILREATSRGQLEKLMVVYTRFDQVEGSNMIDDEDRIDHILGIQNGAIEAMQEAYNLNPKLIRQLRDHLKDATFFFPNTNELKNTSDELKEEMDKFIQALCDKSLDVDFQTPNANGNKAIPSYDFGRLVLVINETEELFMQKWMGLLGLSTSQFPKQHWMRIKALSNRLANWPNTVEYNDLKPASDLASYMMQRINEFINTPKQWSTNVPDEIAINILQNLSQTISDKINQLVLNRIKIENHVQWITAYNFRGTGSTILRAKEMRDIFEKTIPRPKITYDSHSDDLLEAIKNMITEAIELTLQEEKTRANQI